MVLGVGNLCKIDGKMDSELYRRILTDDFLGTLTWYNLNKEDVIFQQDNDPKHTAKLTKEWFEENDIKVLEWPAQSPDLNPIEHLWNEVDRRLRKLPVKVTKKDQLWEQIQDVWNDINLEVCTKLIESMPQRIKDVMKARGGYTRW
jgi:transposase